MTPKIYTPNEANRTLPLIRAIVRDVVASWKRLQAARREQRKALARRPRLMLDADAGARETEARLGREIHDLEAQVEDLRIELEELGCYLRDPIEKGLVDFPGVMGTDLVCLCWHMGEDAVAYYHGMREGFSDRKPLPREDGAGERRSAEQPSRGRSGG